MADYAALYDDRRSAWNAAPPLRPRTAVPLSARTEFFNHYIGPGSPGFKDKPHSACLTAVKSWQRYHQSKDWKDIGYNALICQHGRCIEGRGLEYSGSHCPNHNTSGFGVQFMVAGSEVPTDAAYRRMRRLYDELAKMKGGTLAKKGHRDGISTACPGDIVYAWVKKGMPYPATVEPAPTPKPTPIPVPKPTPIPALVVDGFLGPATIKRWQKIMGTTVDGVISRPSELVKAVQRHLNKHGAKLTVDGLGIQSNNNGRYPESGYTNTIKALQKYLGVTQDGYFSSPSNTIKALQKRLNTGKF